MENKGLTYNQMLQEFGRSLNPLMRRHLSGNINITRRIIKEFIGRWRPSLYRWYFALLMQLINEEEFCRLFAREIPLLRLSTLKRCGLAGEKLPEFRKAVVDLFLETAVNAVRRESRELSSVSVHYRHSRPVFDEEEETEDQYDYESWLL